MDFDLSFFVGLENSAHVLEQNGKMYSATLGLVDIVRGTNSYYKLQLLEDDVQKRSFHIIILYLNIVPSHYTGSALSKAKCLSHEPLL